VKTFQYWKPIPHDPDPYSFEVQFTGSLRDTINHIKTQHPDGGVAPDLGIVFDTEGKKKGGKVTTLGLVLPFPTTEEIKEALQVRTIKMIREQAESTIQNPNYIEHLKEHSHNDFQFTTQLAGDK